MAGIGDVIGVVQFGFSLATQLKNYYDDFQDAGEDITNLANSLTSICGNLEELQDLIDKDATTHGFTDHGRLGAQTCCVQGRKLADKLWKLVRKSNKAEFPQGRVVSAEEIDFTKFRFQWPLVKPKVEQSKAELLYLDLKIMMVKKEYCEPGMSMADRDRAARERDSLKKAKQRALDDLKDIRAKKRRKGRKVHISDEPPAYRSRTPSSTGTSASGLRRMSSGQRRGSTDGAGFGQASAADADEYGDEEYAHDDDPGYDADYDGVGGRGLPESILLEVVDRMAPRLRDDILQEIEEEKRMQAENDAKRKLEKELAIQEYRHSLVEDLRKSQQEAEELKQQLADAFAGNVAQEQIVKYVEQRQVQAVQGNQVAELLTQLGVKAPAPDPGKAESGEGNVDEMRGRRRHGLFKVFRRISSPSRSSTRGPASSRSSNDGSTAVTVTDPHILSVIVSIDGDLRRANRISLPSSWVGAILASQNTRRWWKSASFKETVRTYARLDFVSRKLAESLSEDEGFRPNDLVLLYARRLDEGLTKRRKMLEATLLASEPWSFFHGRMLLVYKMGKHDGKDVSGGDGSAVHSDSGSYRTRRLVVDRQDRYEDPEPSEVSRSASRPDSPDNLNAGDEDGAGRKDGRNEYQTYERVEERWYDAPERSRSRSRAHGDYGEGPDDYTSLKKRSGSRNLRGSYDDYDTRQRSSTGHHSSDWNEATGLGKRPIWMRMHRRHIEPHTLMFYDIPWEFDRQNPDYILVKRAMDQHELDVLFEHTKRLRNRNYTHRSSNDSHRRSSYDDYYQAPPAELRASYDDSFSPSPQERSRGDSNRSSRRSSRRSSNDSYRRGSYEEYYPASSQEPSSGVYRSKSRSREEAPIVYIRNLAHEDVRQRESSRVLPEAYHRAPRSVSDRQQREELVEDLTDLALRDRTRSRSRSQSRSQHSEAADARKRLLEMAKRAERSRLEEERMMAEELRVRRSLEERGKLEELRERTVREAAEAKRAERRRLEERMMAEELRETRLLEERRKLEELRERTVREAAEEREDERLKEQTHRQREVEEASVGGIQIIRTAGEGKRADLPSLSHSGRTRSRSPVQLEPLAEERIDRQSQESPSTSSISRSPSSQRLTTERPEIDTIVEKEISRSYPRMHHGRELAGTMPSPHTLRRRPAGLSSSQDDYPAKSILKSRSRHNKIDGEGASAADGPAEPEDESASELFSSEIDESDSSSSESNGRVRRTRADSSARESLLGLDRKLTESPTSVSSEEKAETNITTSTKFANGKGKERAMEFTEIYASKHTYVHPYAESFGDGHSGISIGKAVHDGSSVEVPAVEETERAGEEHVRSESEDEKIFHSAEETNGEAGSLNEETASEGESDWEQHQGLL